MDHHPHYSSHQNYANREPKGIGYGAALTIWPYCSGPDSDFPKILLLMTVISKLIPYESLPAWDMTRIQQCFVDRFQRDLLSAYLNFLSYAGDSVTSKYTSCHLVTPKVDY